MESGSGTNFKSENSDREFVNFSETNQRQLENALTTPEGRASIRNLFFGKDFDILLDRLQANLNEALPPLENQLGTTGIFIDRMV